ncbi:UNVERIFIED_CONTAM: hypothetical protein FKN15_046494 [Acipenser sinensis]
MQSQSEETEGHPQAVLTLQPVWAQIFTGETVTLSCEVERGSAGWSGVYWCESASGQERSNAVNLTVSNQWVILQTPPQPVIEVDTLTLRCRVRTVDTPKPVLTRESAGEIFQGDTVTLSCVVEGGSTGWRYLWYRDRQGAPVYQTDSSSGTGAGYTISAAALSHSGEYWCGAGWGRNMSYSQYSDPIWVNITALFSRVTLTASPGDTVKEGEALNLTCEAAVNKTPRPELHYTIVRDGEPVTNSTDSALYSIASTEKSHTGSYTCAVESQGVKKSSQELHIEVQKSALSVKVYGAHQHTLILYLPPPASWQSAAAAAGFSVGFFVILLIVFTLLLLYHKIRGVPCITGGKRRERSDQNQDQAAGGVELSSQAQQPVYMCSCPWLSWCKSVSSELFGEQEDCGAELLLKPEDPPQSVRNP